MRRAYHTPIGDPCEKCGLRGAAHRYGAKYNKSEHAPVGNPCTRCGKSAAKHRVCAFHEPAGDPCEKCGKRAYLHKTPKKSYHNPVGDPCEKCGRPAHRHRIGHKCMGSPCERCGTHGAKHKPIRWQYFGIDGEGQGRKEHIYILLALSNESGDRAWSIENPNGIDTKAALDFLVERPLSKNVRIFSFSFNYDLTKILKDVDNATLYRLFRPELRQRKGKEAVKGPIPVPWNGFLLNLQGTKFSIKRKRDGARLVIWDLFKFYQTKFVSALRLWKVGTDEALTRMQLMKDKRHLFDEMPFEQVKAYCFDECRYMAELGRKLVEAHETAGLQLNSFYGAGSTGSALLTKMGIRSKIKEEPPEMRHAVACAFIGGRFENSAIGVIPECVYNLDISAAYPYEITFLPCLEHGEWTHTKRRKDLEKCTHALVRYTLGRNPGYHDWAPFPFRDKEGSICYPIESGGGWVYREEYLAGEKGFSHVQFQEAWIYRTDCDCKPFQEMPRYYLERIRLGKEGPGIVVKLGTNSCYGKIAQSVGSAIFNCWLWAGMITSGTRSLVLGLMNQHKDRSNLLMIATDGVYTREDVATPLPKDTGTWETKKPLGGWERKVHERGVFIARPGIYFPLAPTVEDLASVRGRGVGKGVILENWENIIHAWQRDGISKSVAITNVSRFCGAKSSISRSGLTPATYRYKRAPTFGQWITRPVDMSFDPMPKRAGLAADGKSLLLRAMPRDLESAPYKKAKMSQDARALKIGELEMLEQPDPDFSDYEGRDI